MHTARDKASRKSSEESRTCSQRLSEYLEEKRREEAKKREQQAEEEARKNRRKADSDREEREEQATRERREREKQAQDQRDKERGVKANDAQNEASRIERMAREAQWATAAAQQEARLAEQRAKQAAEQRERDKRDLSIYDKLAKELAAAKEIKGQLSSALEFARNPFKSVAELTADAVASSAVNLSVNPFLPARESSNSTYDFTATVVDSARSRALAGNPFAERISGMAMDGVNQIHRRVLGEAESASEAIRQFDAGSNASGPVFRPSTPAPQSGDNDPSPPPSAYSSQNPFNAPTVSTYYDPDSQTNLEVPSGHVLYRDPNSARLSVVSLTRLTNPPSSGDRPELGEKSCGITGVGIVTPECEKKRRTRANPFGAK